jgi:uncharacterized membrane protein YdjX (TVP38/TMEM64 family)
MCFVFGKLFQFDLEGMRAFLSSFSLVVSGIIFILIYVVLTNLIWFGPKDVLRIASAVLFGAWISTLLVWISEICNAAILFSLSRQLGQEYFEQKFRMKKARIEEVKKKSGIFGSFVLRINPLIPFRFQDLIAGLSRITLGKYIGAIILPSLLRIYWLQFLLAALGVNIFKNPDVLNEYLATHPEALMMSSVYFLLVIILSITAGIMKLVEIIANQRLKKIPEGEV